MNKQELQNRTKKFAHDCVKLAVSLPASTLGNHLRGQLIRSSTSVASNYRASCHAQSRAAFIAKISIVVEESDESEFWLEFIIDEGLIDKDIVSPVYKEARELSSIFVASRRTASANKQGVNQQSSINNQQS